MDDEAKQLAKALFDNKESLYTQVYTVPDAEGDRILIIAMRTKRSRVATVQKSMVRLNEVVAGPFGDICSCCNGTGKAN